MVLLYESSLVYLVLIFFHFYFPPVQPHSIVNYFRTGRETSVSCIDKFVIPSIRRLCVFVQQNTERHGAENLQGITRTTSSCGRMLQIFEDAAAHGSAAQAEAANAKAADA